MFSFFTSTRLVVFNYKNHKMFQSFKRIRFLGYKNKSDGRFPWEHELIDSEFGAISVIGTGLGFEVELGVAVIQEYSQRNLHVAANLVVAFVWWHKEHPWLSVQEIIDYNKRHNSLFSQYEEDLQKYLVLL
jgi:hypothetical protein